jgi:ferredoxin/flavodoxin---NADP+ reductase
MAYAITQACCGDASCVSVCPVNCIHPTPDEPGFGSTDLLYVDPRTCIDCGACADACPVVAISPADLADPTYVALNERYYESKPVAAWDAPRFPRAAQRLRVAIIGTGPAAGYTAATLLRGGAEVTMIDRMPAPGGLVRYGVAPDHPSTKKLDFAAVYRHPRLTLRLNVDVGADVTHAEVAAHHHAVIYAVGAAADRALAVPGAELTTPASTFVGWYNGHPDVPAGAVDLSGERVVVVGTGNVALDVARILVTDPERLAGTEIARHALAALRRSRVREVVLLGRRGPEHAAYTAPELLALKRFRLLVDGEPGGLLADVPAEQVDWTRPPPDGRRIVFRFHAAPVEVRSDGILVTGAEIPARLVIRAIGYEREPVPHQAGRVAPGTYVVGWAKRGASGGIGANRACAAETVDSLLDDAAAHRLPAPTGTAREFSRLLRQHGRRRG